MQTFYVATAPATPAAPTETAVTQIGDFDSDKIAIQVSWVAPANNGAPVTGYKLYMAEGAREYNLIYDGTGRSDILTYTATQGITKSVFYKFKVQALNIIGSSALSSSLTSLAAVAPSTPLNFAIVTSGSGTIDVSWEAPTHDGGAALSGYIIYYRVVSATLFSSTSLLSANSLVH